MLSYCLKYTRPMIEQTKDESIILSSSCVVCVCKKSIFINELDKACFQHDMAFGGFKYLLRRTASGKELYDEAFNIAKNSNYDEYHRGLVLMVYKFFDKKTYGGAVKSEIMSD